MQLLKDWPFIEACHDIRRLYNYTVIVDQPAAGLRRNIPPDFMTNCAQCSTLHAILPQYHNTLHVVLPQNKASTIISNVPMQSCNPSIPGPLISVRTAHQNEHHSIRTPSNPQPQRTSPFRPKAHTMRKTNNYEILSTPCLPCLIKTSVYQQGRSLSLIFFPSPALPCPRVASPDFNAPGCRIRKTGVCISIRAIYYRTGVPLRYRCMSRLELP